MAASAFYRFPSTIASFSCSTDRKSPLSHSHHCKIFKPVSISGLKSPSVRVCNNRLKFSSSTRVVSRQVFKVRGLVDGDSAAGPEPESDISEVGATIDLKLPRRSMLVEFTCNLCGERTRRLVNRLAYERGVIFVQSLCSNWLFFFVSGKLHVFEEKENKETRREK
ncbi:uncharacterized protein LOC129311059 isoform X2 [Prosopis cineraria]|uniref:uncharacterized protein LOC129297465 isoform X2 n=1 Tax=Prosopis cineraria TaxID=364024 RepID=UPI002410759A|nr:uncharacterized protein LOC129297465 isoform X2 [Prosopis cineraria]XP_054808997.1 uncharacterized protein LOC129311059 isoform X2 [Prosopis cineraria]